MPRNIQSITCLERPYIKQRLILGLCQNDIRKIQFWALLLLFNLLTWAVIHVTLLNGYHDGEYSVGVAAVSNHYQKKSLDVLETVFIAETAYLDRVNLNISDVPVHNDGYLNIQLEHGGHLLYTGNKPLKSVNSDEWFSVHLGISLKPGDQYRLVFASRETNTLPNIYLSDDRNTPVFTYTYKNNLSRADKVMSVCCYIILYAACAFLILRYRRVYSWLQWLLSDHRTGSQRKVYYPLVIPVVTAAFLFGSVYSAYDGTPPVNAYMISNDLNAFDKSLAILYYLALSLLCIYAVLKSVKIIAWVKNLVGNLRACKWSVGFYSVANATAAALALSCSKAAGADNILFYFFLFAVLVSGVWLENNLQKVINELMSNAKNVVIYALLSLYTSFSIIGSRCFIYPINMHLSLTAMLCFITMSIAVFPLVVCLTGLLGHSGRQYVQRAENMPWKISVLCFGIIIFGALFYMRAFNPAISSQDTVFCMERAINSIRGMINWQPTFYILWLKAILRVWNSASAVLLFQYIWFAFVFLEGMRFLYRRGISSVFIVLITVLTVLNCANMVHLTTIWKDIPYAISVLWLTVLTARLILEKQNHKWLIYVELIIALICTAFMRQNGIVIFLIVTPILLCSFRKSWKMRCSCAISVTLAVLISFPFYAYLGIKNDEGGGKFVGLGQDIMAAYYNGGTLSDSAMRVVNALSNNNISEFVYNPYVAQDYVYQSFELNVPEFIVAYIDTFIRNPVLMTREIVNRQDGVWNLLAGQDGGMRLVNYTNAIDGYGSWNSFVPERKNNLLTERVSEFTAMSASHPLLNMVEWRAGIWVLCIVFAFAVCVFFKNNRKLWILFAVPIGHVLSLVLSLGWSDYRYYWPLTLISMFLILLTLTINEREKISLVES